MIKIAFWGCGAVFFPSFDAFCETCTAFVAFFLFLRSYGKSKRVFTCVIFCGIMKGDRFLPMTKYFIWRNLMKILYACALILGILTNILVNKSRKTDKLD